MAEGERRERRSKNGGREGEIEVEEGREREWRRKKERVRETE